MTPLQKHILIYKRSAPCASQEGFRTESGASQEACASCVFLYIPGNLRVRKKGDHKAGRGSVRLDNYMVIYNRNAPGSSQK